MLCPCARKFVDALPPDSEPLSTSQAAKGVEYCNRSMAWNASLQSILRKNGGKSGRQSWNLCWKSFSPGRKASRPSAAASYLRPSDTWLPRKNIWCAFWGLRTCLLITTGRRTPIRPFWVGRKNWLFSASVKGAQVSAILYSLAATACANGLNMEEYLNRLFQVSKARHFAYALVIVTIESFLLTLANLLGIFLIPFFTTLLGGYSPSKNG